MQILTYHIFAFNQMSVFMHIHYIHMFLIYQRLIVDLYLFLSMVLLTDR